MTQATSSETKGRGTARRLILITGASSGIGAAFARAYAKRGFDLALTARRADRLLALAEELSEAHDIDAYAIPADLSQPDAHENVLEPIVGLGRVVDGLVNNAGFGIAHDFAAVPWAKQRDFLNIQVMSACGLAHGVIGGMVERGWGRIVNVASVAAFSPGVAGNSLYPAAKMLLVKFSQSLDAELRGKGVKVTALCPGATRSEFMATAGVQQVADHSPGRFTQPAETVVETAIAANEAGKLICIPGWHNRLAVGLMRTLPEPWVRSLIAWGSAKYRL